MADWRTDSEIIDAAEHLKATFVWLKEDEGLGGGYPRSHIEGIYRDRDIFLSLDPQRLADKYEQVRAAALEVGDNYPAVADLRESIRHLANWTGEAAEQFKRQIDKMEIFCDEQQTRVLRGLQSVAAAFALATESRDSYIKLVRATEAAARNAKEDAAKEDAKLEAAVLFNIVDGVLGMNPGRLLGVAVVTGVQIAKDVSQRVIEDDDSDQVMDGYRREADWLCESLGHSLDRLTKDLHEQAGDAAKPADMYKPLPPICDVRSPDFRYEHFQDLARDTGPVGPIVEEERRKYVEEKKAEAARVSEIERRLGHGGRDVK